MRPSKHLSRPFSPSSLRLRSHEDMPTAAMISDVLPTSAEGADRTFARRGGPIGDEADWVSEKTEEEKGWLGSCISKTALLSFLD